MLCRTFPPFCTCSVKVLASPRNHLYRTCIVIDRGCSIRRGSSFVGTVLGGLRPDFGQADPERGAWPNHVWSYDFVMDRTHDGRSFRMLTVIDEFTRQCLAIIVDRKLNSDNVLHCLTDLFVQHGLPDHIRSDNGSEFTANAVRAWLARVGVKTLFIESGSPWENGYNESFNSKLRDEILNMEIFYTLKEAKVLIERWRHHYNTVWPHSSLGYRPPAPETILPTVDVPAYARQWLRPAHQLKPRQTLT